MKKMISVMLLTILIFASLPKTSSAHAVDQSSMLDSEYVGLAGYGYYCVGRESEGWLIDERAHLGGTTVEYKYGALVPSAVKTLFESAAAIWTRSTSANFIRCTESTATTSSFGTVKIAYDISYASFIPLEIDSSGHITEWEIKINPLTNNTIATVAHEIGHLFGLVDLAMESNSNKLMYYSPEGTATTLTSPDIKGFEVITGIHNYHTEWKYSTPAFKYCAHCGGRKTVDERYTYAWSQYDRFYHKGVCNENSNIIVYEQHRFYQTAGAGCSRCGYADVIIDINSHTHDFLLQ